jgi:hypothetical protein
MKHKNAAGFTGRLGANTTQKLGTKVFKALEHYLLGGLNMLNKAADIYADNTSVSAF